MVKRLPFLACIVLSISPALAAGRYPPKLDDAEQHKYKQVEDVALHLYVFKPKAIEEPRPAIVFFFGGGWSSGSPEQFAPHCRYLASRGMVAVAADYRVAKRHGVKAVDCVRDAKSAIRWVREHADKLNIDPDRIVAAGGSAGGHLAACTGNLQNFDETDEDASISSRPAALVLFNPVLSFVPDDPAKFDRRIKGFAKRTGVEPKQLSPAHNIAADAPPTLVLVGTEDYVADGIKQFAAGMKAAGRPCEVKWYEGRAHGFFNPNRGREDHLATMEDMDRFLQSLNYVEGPPTVSEFSKDDNLR
jgi:acetyl esterase/lipase